VEWREQHQAAKAKGHTAVVVKNVFAVLNGQQPPAKYKGQYELTVVSLGRVSPFLHLFGENVG